MKWERDMLWYEALDIWCELGGKPTGGDAADFVMAVSAPVFAATLTVSGRKTAATMPQRTSVLAQLRRLAKMRTHKNGDDFSSAS